MAFRILIHWFITDLKFYFKLYQHQYDAVMNSNWWCLYYYLFFIIFYLRFECCLKKKLTPFRNVIYMSDVCLVPASECGLFVSIHWREHSINYGVEFRESETILFHHVVSIDRRATSYGYLSISIKFFSNAIQTSTPFMLHRIYGKSNVYWEFIYCLNKLSYLFGRMERRDRMHLKNLN